MVCINMKDICFYFLDEFIQNKEIGCKNYDVFLEVCSKNEYQMSVKSRIGAVNKQCGNFFSKTISILHCATFDSLSFAELAGWNICELSVEEIEQMGNNEYIFYILGAMGRYLREKSTKEDIALFMEGADYRICEHKSFLYDVFLELLGFEL